MTRSTAVLKHLTRGEPITDRVVIVTAHPDDETVSLGGTLALFTNAYLVQLTDGAIDDPDAWAKAGTSCRETYAALRCREQDAALRALGASCVVGRCDIMDQQTIQHLGLLLAWIAAALAETAVVITHPYEGGHPDHDSAAWLVQEACAAMGHPPDRLECASYHWDGVTRRAGVFWPVATHPAVSVTISGDRLTRKQQALACYGSQASVTRWFPVGHEQYRTAPRYDFTNPPTTPECWYDRKAWKITSAQWREAAGLAMARQAVAS